MTPKEKQNDTLKVRPEQGPNEDGRARSGHGLMILLHPVAVVSIFDQHLQGGAARKVTPEILPLPLLSPSGPLPNQPAHMAGSIAIHQPAPQGQQLRPPPPCGPLTPRDAVPGAPGLRYQHRIDPAHRSVGSTAQHHTEIGRTAITCRSCRCANPLGKLGFSP